MPERPPAPTPFAFFIKTFLAGARTRTHAHMEPDCCAPTRPRDFRSFRGRSPSNGGVSSADRQVWQLGPGFGVCPEDKQAKCGWKERRFLRVVTLTVGLPLLSSPPPPTAPLVKTDQRCSGGHVSQQQHPTSLPASSASRELGARAADKQTSEIGQRTAIYSRSTDSGRRRFLRWSVTTGNERFRRRGKGTRRRGAFLFKLIGQWKSMRAHVRT